MPRQWKFFLAATVMASGLACGKKQPADSRAVVRYLANPDVGGFSKVIIQKFEEAHPDIRVEMVEGPSAPNTREDMYSTSFMAKEDTYDLVYMDVVWLPKFAAQGWLRPLDDFFTIEERAKYLPGDIQGSIYKEKIYRLPIQSDGGLLYYRKDLLEKNGLKAPRNWTELVEIAKKLQSPPTLFGLVFQGKQYEGLVCNFLELVWGNGGDVTDASGKVVIDSPAAVEALQWMVDAVHKHKISPEGVLTYQEEEARHAFQEGKAVFMRNWPYAWNLMQDEKSPVRGKVGIIPMPGGSGKKPAATLGGWGFGISAFSKNPQAAWKFIEFAALPENQKTAFFKGGILPTRRSLFDDPEILQASPQIKDLGKVLTLARPRPVHPSYARVSDALQLHVSAALSLQEEPREALFKAAEEIRAALR